MRSGALWLTVRPSGFGDEVWRDALSRHVTSDDRGHLTYRVPKTGVYEIGIDPTTAAGRGSGYDLTYTVTWGANWGG